MANKLQFEWDDKALINQFKAIQAKYKNKAKVRSIAKPASKIAVKYLREGAIERGDTAKYAPPSYYKPKRRKRKGVDAVYYSGNAKRSMRSFAFRKSYFMHVGAKVNRGSAAGGDFNTGNKVEGFYNYFLEYGTKKMRARRQMSGSIMRAKGAVETSLRQSMNADLKMVALQTKK